MTEKDYKMNRLTKKMKHYCDTDIDFDYKFADEDVCVGEIVDKLGQLEDLEEQLGCPLEVVVKAIKYGIYYTARNEKNFLERSFKLYHYSSGWCLIKPKLQFYLEDYKKTWWLKWDKSE